MRLQTSSSVESYNYGIRDDTGQGMFIVPILRPAWIKMQTERFNGSKKNKIGVGGEEPTERDVKTKSDRVGNDH